jgi:hypothetical protein
MDSDQPSQAVDLTLLLQPGQTELDFRTDRDGELLGNGDQRKLAFNLDNFTMKALR